MNITTTLSKVNWNKVIGVAGGLVAAYTAFSSEMENQRKNELIKELVERVSNLEEKTK